MFGGGRVRGESRDGFTGYQNATSSNGVNKSSLLDEVENRREGFGMGVSVMAMPLIRFRREELLSRMECRQLRIDLLVESSKRWRRWEVEEDVGEEVERYMREWWWTVKGRRERRRDLPDSGEQGSKGARIVYG